MVKIILSNGKIITKQKLFGNQSKFLGIAIFFYDSSTNINNKQIEIFENKIFRNHVKQKNYKFKTNLLGKLFFISNSDICAISFSTIFFLSITSISRYKRLNLIKAF